MHDIMLDKGQIVAEVLLLLREGGIEKLSMRKLAARLNIRAPTLYWYFPDRSSILRAVIRTLQRESFARNPESDIWQEWLRGLALSFWQNNCETPYVNLLLQSAELNDESVVRDRAGSSAQSLPRATGDKGATGAFLRDRRGRRRPCRGSYTGRHVRRPRLPARRAALAGPYRGRRAASPAGQALGQRRSAWVSWGSSPAFAASIGWRVVVVRPA